MARRLWPQYGLALSCLVIMAAATVTAVARAHQDPTPRSDPTSAVWPSTTSDSTSSTEARIDVAVATLWVSPDLTRPIDTPSLTNPVDIAHWTASMTVPEKLWLVGKLATQALYGEPVVVLETRGNWTKVAVTDQPSSLDPRGYPGWLPRAQLTSHHSRDAAEYAVIIKPTAVLRAAAAPDQTLMDLSYNTRLPVVSVASAWTTVSTPDGRPAAVASSDVEIVGLSSHPPTGADLVRTAQMFSGLSYLWAGTSGFGFDCSGFTEAIYAAHGIVIPRDANDQATTGSPVAPGQLQPGDLLFYAGNGGRGLVHHVAMYVGGGQIIQSPATGLAVETVPLGLGGFSGQYWGARRYLPTS